MKTIQKEHPISKMVREHIEKELGVDLKNISRKRNLVYARFVYFKVMTAKTKLPLSAIGGFIDKDHSNVIHGVKVFDNIISKHELHLVQLTDVLFDMVDCYQSQAKKENSPAEYWREKYINLNTRYNILKKQIL